MEGQGLRSLKKPLATEGKDRDIELNIEVQRGLFLWERPSNYFQPYNCV